MSTGLKILLDSSFGINLVSAVGQRLPPAAGYRLADLLGGLVASRRNSAPVQAVRANQWVVRGGALEGEAMDKAVRETFYHAARSIYDMHHYGPNPKAASQRIVLDSKVQQFARRPEFDERGLVVVGLHLSSFDLVLQWMCMGGLRPLVLTIPNPQGGRRAEYEIRKRTGMNLVPASVGAFRQALKHLRQGGFVVTGIDRPIPDPPACPLFFGRPAALPTHHVFLAQKARVPVLIMVSFLQPDGSYRVTCSELIEMDDYPDRESGTVRNAEKVLRIAESFIRQAPEQWSISLPVWPQVMNLVPD
jgi:phosphatidylinositol dimannoside acyltransferase